MNGDQIFTIIVMVMLVLCIIMLLLSMLFNVKVDNLENGDVVAWYSWNKKRRYFRLFRNREF